MTDIGLIKLSCGGCGNTKHEIYKFQNGELLVECLECQSRSEITLTEPRIEIENYDGPGTLTED